MDEALRSPHGRLAGHGGYARHCNSFGVTGTNGGNSCTFGYVRHGDFTTPIRYRAQRASFRSPTPWSSLFSGSLYLDDKQAGSWRSLIVHRQVQSPRPPRERPATRSLTWLRCKLSAFGEYLDGAMRSGPPALAAVCGCSPRPLNQLLRGAHEYSINRSDVDAGNHACRRYLVGWRSLCRRQH